MEQVDYSKFPNPVLANRCSVSRADDMVVVVVDVELDELDEATLDKPMQVMACFEIPEHAERVADAITAAAQDVRSEGPRKDSNERGHDGQVADLSTRRRSRGGADE